MRRPSFLALALGSVGVVYGDIGTSPLYAFREAAIAASDDRPVTRDIVLGVLSLILWALIVVVTLKYVLILLRADNNGEGGTLSLTALATPRARPAHRRSSSCVGVIGAAMFLGDSRDHAGDFGALGGRRAEARDARPSSDYVVPLTVVILIALFAAQSRGTAQGRGVVRAGHGGLVRRDRDRRRAAHPRRSARARRDQSALRASASCSMHGHIGLVTLGAVFLAVTGGEALYADLGHFGRKPIQTAWLGLVLPALLINYFGQGAHGAGRSGGDRESVLSAGARMRCCCRWSCWRPPRP